MRAQEMLAPHASPARSRSSSPSSRAADEVSVQPRPRAVQRDVSDLQQNLDLLVDWILPFSPRFGSRVGVNGRVRPHRELCGARSAPADGSAGIEPSAWAAKDAPLCNLGGCRREGESCEEDLDREHPGSIDGSRRIRLIRGLARPRTGHQHRARSPGQDAIACAAQDHTRQAAPVATPDGDQVVSPVLY